MSMHTATLTPALSGSIAKVVLRYGCMALVSVALASACAAEPETLSARDIVARAHTAAGGATWKRPRSLYMSGYGLFYTGDAVRRHESHRMWRVYADDKRTAHAADGKVRIDSIHAGDIAFQIAFDGATTYDQNGPIAGASDSRRWQASFGFGVIRFALDPGFSVERMPDDSVDGHATYTVRVTDPGGGKTLFGIARDDYRIRRLGFDTPRGWHERVYSNFFTNPDVDWVQPGRVRLYYDGIKSNEIIWTQFQLNEDIDPALFVLPATAN